MIEKIQLQRVFVLNKDKNNINLPDPDQDMTPDQVRKFYAGRYPELVTSTVTGPTYDGDKAVFTFKTSIGVKG